MGFSRGLAAEVGRARRDRQLHVARHDAARPARGGDRAKPELEQRARQGVPGRAHRPCDDPRRWPCSCAATPPSGSPARCTRSTAATSRRCRATFSARPSQLSRLVPRQCCRGIRLSLVRLVLLSRSYGCAYPHAPSEARPKRRRNTRRRRSGAPDRLGARSKAAADELRGHGADALAVGLVVIGVLTVLGLASDLAGSVGSFLADGSATMLGRGRYRLPCSHVSASRCCCSPATGPAASMPTRTTSPRTTRPARRRHCASVSDRARDARRRRPAPPRRWQPARRSDRRAAQRRRSARRGGGVAPRGRRGVVGTA